MVNFKVADVARAMELGKLAAVEITKTFPKPVKLEFEKVRKRQAARHHLNLVYRILCIVCRVLYTETCYVSLWTRALRGLLRTPARSKEWRRRTSATRHCDVLILNKQGRKCIPTY